MYYKNIFDENVRWGDTDGYNQLITYLFQDILRVLELI